MCQCVYDEIKFNTQNWENKLLHQSVSLLFLSSLLSIAMLLRRMRYLLPHCCYSTNSSRPSQLLDGPGLKDFIPSSRSVAPAAGLAEVGGERVPYLRDEDVEGQGRKGQCVPLSHSHITRCFNVKHQRKYVFLLEPTTFRCVHTLCESFAPGRFPVACLLNIKSFFMDITICSLNVMNEPFVSFVL